jgi:hypothetical protein
MKAPDELPVGIDVPRPLVLIYIFSYTQRVMKFSLLEMFFYEGTIGPGERYGLMKPIVGDALSGFALMASQEKRRSGG